MLLPVAPLPQVDFPSISVSASLPGASAETMASAVATPLERQFGRIAGITEMSSTSSLGSTSIAIMFDLNRNIDAAARDVQAAINAARSQLPTNLPSNPTWRKINPSDAPIMILTLTSPTYTKARIYDAASTILAQKLAQVRGVGQVMVGGGASPAVRIDVNPTMLNHFGLGLEDVRAVLATANANRPKGAIENEDNRWTITTTDQLLTADEYRPLIVAYKNGAAVRLGDIGHVTDSVEDILAKGIFSDKPAVSMIIFRQPGANIIQTVDRIRALLPGLEAAIPADISVQIALDRTSTIRASVDDVQFTLLLSVGLVILVVFVFLRNVRATIIPSVAVPVSLIGTFGVMYLAGYSLDNLSLMAMTIATGFVVDDAIVVVENISRHLEAGMQPLEASLLGAKEIGFTVLSISISLVAVFIPILLMEGYIGRLFREFAVTLSVAIGVSMVVSLTTTPMMCAAMLKAHADEHHGWLFKASEWVFDCIISMYERTLSIVLRHQFFTLLVTLATIGFTVYLYVIVPKGLFPQQDTGRLIGNIQADQNISYHAMEPLLKRYAATILDDPAVESLTASIGGQNGGAANASRMFITLKPLAERGKNDAGGKVTADDIMVRLRPKLSKVPGGNLTLQAVQDLRIGARASSALYQYTIQSDNLSELQTWAPQLLGKMRETKGLADVNTDWQNRGLQAGLSIDRLSAAVYGISQQAVDDTLYDAFGQRQVSTMYMPLNQYHVVLEVEPEFLDNPQSLQHLYVPGRNDTEIPLNAIARYTPSTTSLAVAHTSLIPSVTISFNLLPGTSLGEAVEAITELQREMGMPNSIRGSFQGTAQAFQASLRNQPLLILAALVTVYIVLGVLYESYIHPITILSTLPSAGVGALLALLLCKTELNVMALIGIILLIGIVKKNAIMMIDFALEAERTHGKSPEESIYEACVLRFRPITMTTMAALLGGLPLALGTGVGAELRRPMGIAIVGGLIFSQMLTLYTTPVVYLYLDRFRLWWAGHKRSALVHAPEPETAELIG